MVYRPLCPKIARTPMLAQTLQILEFATNENHKREISVEGRSSCINMKKKKKGGTNAVKNSGFFLAPNAVVILKIEARSGFTVQKAMAGETNKNKKSLF